MPTSSLQPPEAQREYQVRSGGWVRSQANKVRRATAAAACPLKARAPWQGRAPSWEELILWRMMCVLSLVHFKSHHLGHALKVQLLP